MFQDPKKRSAIINGTIILLLGISFYLVANTSTKDLYDMGLMNSFLYEIIILLFPLISIPFIFKFTDDLRDLGLKNKLAFRVIRYGFLIYALHFFLGILFIFILALLGMGVSV